MRNEPPTPEIVSHDALYYDAFLSYRSLTDYDRARKIEAFLRILPQIC